MSDQARRQRKNERSRFKRRSDRLFEQTDEFGKLFNSRVYLVVQSREGEFLIYNNSSDKGWPPSPHDGVECETPSSLATASAAEQHRSKFEKKKRRLLVYADNFASHFAANVYLVIQHATGYMISYNSSQSKAWPPPKKQIKRLCPSAKWRGPQEYDGPL
ncbi:hypothetical protein BDV59DRAFT_205435 [Aspergillus ambiguus]|uniref:uncharacterized protein n=1 Tax=Aspergillus ambiguus TaxID=176160 RepID=UPI003CCCC5D7